MQVRLWRAVGSLQYFTTNQWLFDTTNVVNLLSRMCAEDRQVVSRVNNKFVFMFYAYIGFKCNSFDAFSKKIVFCPPSWISCH